MEYNPLASIPYYSENSRLIEGLGYILVELKVIPQKTQTRVQVVIAKKSDDENKPTDESGVGIADCAKVHRLIEPRLEALLGTQDLYMEVTSPGMERNIKNAAEFSLFKGRYLRVWDQDKSDWVSGVISASDEKSVTLKINDADSEVIPYERIAKAKLLSV